MRKGCLHWAGGKGALGHEAQPFSGVSPTPLQPYRHILTSRLLPLQIPLPGTLPAFHMAATFPSSTCLVL